MSLSLAEQETILRFDRESDVMVFETFSAAYARKLLARGATLKRKWSRGGATAWTLEMPKKWFRLPLARSEARSRGARLRALSRTGSVFFGRTRSGRGKGSTEEPST